MDSQQRMACATLAVVIVGKLNRENLKILLILKE